jgi:hypothetical protein
VGSREEEEVLVCTVLGGEFEHRNEIPLRSIPIGAGLKDEYDNETKLIPERDE